MIGTGNPVKLHIIKLIIEPDSSLTVHPVILPIVKLNRFLKIHSVDHALDRMLSFQWPFEYYIEADLTHCLLSAQIFEVSFPGFVLLVLKFEP